MSTASASPKTNKSRLNSLQRSGILHRGTSYSRRKPFSPHDVYLYALRVAYLSYLLQPPARRLQHVPAANQKVQRSSTSVTDLLKDISLVRDSKSTRFPHGFMAYLDTRIKGVLLGTERMPEFNDPLVKQTFAVFLNAFIEPTFRKSVEKDRRVEDLLLIFFSHATKILQKKELQNGKAPEHDSWKLMVDRHVALFIRLISSILRDHGWDHDRPELATRLQTMEKKLLIHDQDLTADGQRNGGAGGKTIEVDVPRSYELKDMPLALTVQRIFASIGKTYEDVQADIYACKPVWTEKAALDDLKMYQTNLSLGRRTLTCEDFDTDAAYQAWKRSEVSEITEMMLAILQTKMELTKETSTSLPRFNAANVAQTDRSSPGPDYPGLPRRVPNSPDDNPYIIDVPVDMSSLNIDDTEDCSKDADDDEPYTFTPSDPRAYYRFLLKEALTHDLKDNELRPSEATSETPAIKLLSKANTELLAECAIRWRVPSFSRPVLFLDVVREKYQHGEINLDTLDAAFMYVKEGSHDLNRDAKKANWQSRAMSPLDSAPDWHKWTIVDYALAGSCHSALWDSLLRDLFGLMLHCYESKAPEIGPVMYVLEHHINRDPLFGPNAEPPAQFSEELQMAMQERALDVYQDLIKKHIPKDKDKTGFYDVIELGKAVVKLCEKIQKRYRKSPEIMGVSPLMTLVGQVLPAFAADAKHLIVIIVDLHQARGELVSIEDGFVLYKELVDIRRFHTDSLPGVPFGFHIEDELQDFVWRYIADLEPKMTSWVEEAVKMDQFQTRQAFPEQIATDDERHSAPVIDIFSSFNQSVDQIVQLEWDNDLHYAKFMTAVSKAISSGVCKYSELLESGFIRDMEQLTPEQEAMQEQTIQEKWMQMGMQIAKDAWANKEKIEPFQFTPESLVKLNNIEWATLQLDRLSLSVNAEACADVIERHMTPQALQQRLKGRNDKFVFTIKIIEAEDLKACDRNGLSDPYVVLGDEFQKRLYKSRIVHGNLNPRWDESIDITTSGPLNIIATIWDWDRLGDHDCVGRTTLKLDPTHFGDFAPREYWLDLDTQGRLLLRVSMEGERDDVRFWFGKGMRGLKRCEREMTRGIVDKLSAYIHHCLSRGALKRMLDKNYTEQLGVVTSSVKSWLQSRTQNARTSIQFNLTSPPGAQPPPRMSTPLSSNANVQKTVTVVEIEAVLKPLFTYFDDNFAIIKETLTETAMVAVMTRVWKEVLNTLEGLLVPPLIDKPSSQKPLSRVECDVIFKWLDLLLAFFHAVDDETGQPNGIPMEVLRSAKYFDLKTIAYWYFEPTDVLIRNSEIVASASAERRRGNAARLRRLSAPPSSPGSSAAAAFAFGGLGGQYGLPSTRRRKTIMLSRNLGTLRKAKEEKRKEVQAEPTDDMILRILRMRPEAERYLRDRNRQKERLQAAAAAEQIVRMSLAQGMAGGGGIQRGFPRR